MNDEIGQHWTYEQRTGRMFRPPSPYGALVATGYAGGNCGKNPEAINNHDMQSVHNTGPLPLGWYTFGEVVLESKLGPFAIPLMPDSTNEMFGRGGFFCHGDTKIPGNASEGCVIMPRTVREEMAASSVKRLQVI